MKSLHLFSGGLDSVCLARQRQLEGDEVVGLYFDYGQRTRVLDSAAVDHFAAEFLFEVIKVDLRPISHLFKCGYMDANEETVSAAVPYRSQLFFTLGAAYGMTNNFDRVESALWENMEILRKGIPGMSGIDKAELHILHDKYGYKDLFVHTDSRSPFLEAMQKVCDEGEPTGPRISYPYIGKDKLWIWWKLEQMGMKDWAVEHALTCYNLDQQDNDWGRGCGLCGSCSSREIGWWLLNKAKELNIEIPELYEQ